jgi:hypothetical protein
MKQPQLFVLFCIAFVAITYTGYTQDKFRTSLTMGQVYPLGTFSSTNHFSNTSGYAQTGFTLNIDGDYHLNNRLDASLRFHFGNSPIDQVEFSKRLSNELAGYVSGTDTVQYAISYWQWASPMVGLKYNYPIIINKVYVEVGAFTGISIIQLPDQNLIFNDKVNKQFIVSQTIDNTNISLPFAINGGFRFRINQQVQLKINAEYFRTKANYEHVSYYQLENTTEQVEIKKSEFDVTIQTLDITAGLVYNF